MVKSADGFSTPEPPLVLVITYVNVLLVFVIVFPLTSAEYTIFTRYVLSSFMDMFPKRFELFGVLFPIFIPLINRVNISFENVPPVLTILYAISITQSPS